MEPFEDRMRRGGAAALEHVGRLQLKQDVVTESMRRIAQRLEQLQIPYAVAGGMALNAHGHVRGTVDVDILIDAPALERIHQELEGPGYVAPFRGSEQLRDTQTSVRIEFLVAGQFPGDGKPKPVAFPPPAGVAVEIDGIRYRRLNTLIELKLASGMTNPGRLKDLADVQERVRVLGLPRSLGNDLHESVRGKHQELWDGLNGSQ